MSRRSRPMGALVLVVAASIGVNLVAAPAFATDYPSWADVEAAKHNEATKKAEIAKINSLISGLQTEAADAAKVALQKGEDYNQANDALDAATAKADSYQAESVAAQKAADESGARAGEIVAELSRMGGTDLTLQLLLSGSSADDLLYKLGAMDKLTQSSARIYELAQRDRNTADSLDKQAEAAKLSRAGLAEDAKKAYADAEQAAKDATARAANQQEVSATLYAQLAALKGTSAAVEKAYLDGVAWEAAQNAVKHPPPPPPPVNPTPPPPSTSAVAGAIAFARSQLGKPYQLGGSGPSVWDCSGLTKASYASVGVYIGTHSASNQYATMAAAGRLVPYNQLQPGDLLFYSSGGSTSASKYHVTIYIGNGQMIEAPRPGTNVRIATLRYGDLVPYAGRPTP